jgi:hypothetical protein
LQCEGSADLSTRSKEIEWGLSNCDWKSEAWEEGAKSLSNLIDIERATLRYHKRERAISELIVVNGHHACSHDPRKARQCALDHLRMNILSP